MNSSSNAVISLNDIWRIYRLKHERIEVLRGVNLTLYPGDEVALVSPSGSGKSTLLHLAGLLESPDRGNVVIENFSTSGLADQARTALRRDRIGFVYQFHHLMPELTALQNVILPQIIAGKPKSEARERAAGLLERLGLGHRHHHRPGELSGGEQQRVAIARAIANRPRLLLADEPTGNLDPDTSDQVFMALKTIVQQEGLATLIATHNHKLADEFPKRMTLKNGLLVDC